MFNSVFWAIVWTIALLSTWHIGSYLVLVVTDHGSTKFAKQMPVWEFTAALFWAVIIVFWMN